MMQGMGMQYNTEQQGSTSHEAGLDFHWGRVKGAMDELLRTFHSEDQRDSEMLEDIFDYFVQKVEFDSPLADPE